ncbi:hypothetical protein B0H66DRAFT_535184 [Apodospora peruviana]|uniref:Uncharacterized protein n=1 Tax=Apodospora peruviana TaxID=516989 RepID=A0AAE0I2G5_9PEZI|nr:hypothetical protein B0H66DRAFT_535184 [Apodospora peruviana]
MAQRIVDREFGPRRGGTQWRSRSAPPPDLYEQPFRRRGSYDSGISGMSSDSDYGDWRGRDRSRPPPIRRDGSYDSGISGMSSDSEYGDRRGRDRSRPPPVRPINPHDDLTSYYQGRPQNEWPEDQERREREFDWKQRQYERDFGKGRSQSRDHGFDRRWHSMPSLQPPSFSRPRTAPQPPPRGGSQSRHQAISYHEWSKTFLQNRWYQLQSHEEKDFIFHLFNESRRDPNPDSRKLLEDYIRLKGMGLNGKGRYHALEEELRAIEGRLIPEKERELRHRHVNNPQGFYAKIGKFDKNRRESLLQDLEAFRAKRSELMNDIGMAKFIFAQIKTRRDGWTLEKFRIGMAK